MFDLIGKAYAAAAATFPTGGIGQLAGGSLSTYLTGVLSVVLWIAGILAVFYLIYGGIMYVTAGGEEEKATKARTAIVNAIIGIIIIALAIAIVGWVNSAANATAPASTRIN